MTERAELWTIEELVRQVALALSLSGDYAGAPNRRIRDVPDIRTIRYYTTLGLLDRPVQMFGRTALYGRKHLLQLVAIKRLQSQGLSLQEIQQRLLGLSERQLAAIAELPVGGGASRPPFWKRSGLPPQRTQSLPPEAAAVPTAFWLEKHAKQPQPMPPLMQGVPLHENVTVLLTLSRPLTADDVEALAVAAAPLVKCLQDRRLIVPQNAKEVP